MSHTVHVDSDRVKDLEDPKYTDTQTLSVLFVTVLHNLTIHLRRHFELEVNKYL
jgi:hypothetical protein